MKRCWWRGGVLKNDALESRWTSLDADLDAIRT